MLPHLYHLLKNAFLDMPSLVSSNWLAVGMTVTVFVLTLLFMYLKNDWEYMKRQWKENIFIGIIAVMAGWIGLYLLSVTLTVYQDHRQLASTNDSLRAEKSKLVDPKSRDDEISRLRNDISKLQGQSVEESKLRILVRYYGLATETTVNNKVGSVFLVEGLTNKNISPVDVELTCDQDIVPLNTPHLGVGGIYFYLEVKNLTSRTLEIKIGSPAWTPETPLGIPVFTEAKDISCELKERHS